MKILSVGIALAIALVGCEPAEGSPHQFLPELIDEYGCGYGFHAGSADQSVGVLVDFNHWEGPTSATLSTNLAGRDWTAEIRFGSDLSPIGATMCSSLASQSQW